MIKLMMSMISVTAALLGVYVVISFVYAANPTADLPITIVPSGQTSSVPAPAVAAGFNNLIIDFDFTQSNPWSDKSRWLRCHDGSGASSPLLYEEWVGFGGWQLPPCANVGQAIDPLGSPALHIHMDKTTINAMGCEPNCSMSVLAVPIQTVDASGNGGNKIPTNVYVEVVGLPKSSDPSMHNLFADFWSFMVDSSVEWDGIEWFGNNIGFATYHNNGSGNVFNTNEADSMDQSNYHTYAWRVTSNGSDGFFCSYKDGSPAGSSPGNCISWHPTFSQANNPAAGTVQFMAGFSGCGNGNGSCPNSSVDLWVRHLKVWSCAGINSGAKCLSSSANP